MPDVSEWGQASVVFGEVVKIATGALAVWAWKTAKTLSGLAPRVEKLEQLAAVAVTYAEVPAVEKRLAEESAHRSADVAALSVKVDAAAAVAAEIDRKLARLEGKIEGLGTPAMLQDRPSIRQDP